MRWRWSAMEWRWELWSESCGVRLDLCALRCPPVLPIVSSYTLSSRFLSTHLRPVVVSH